MQYRVDELARAAGVGVDTVRFYQNRGLLPPPTRLGRIALYSREHLERLRRIRSLNRQGLKLDAVGRLLAGESEQRAADPGERPSGVRSSLLRALEQSEGERSYSRAELEADCGLPGFAIEALQSVGLLEAHASGHYGERARATLAAARALLDAGLPFAELLPLAREHAAHVERLCERAVALFERALGERPAQPQGEQAAELLRQLLPAAARLVSVHFERTLIARARARLLQAAGEACTAQGEDS